MKADRETHQFFHLLLLINHDLVQVRFSRFNHIVSTWGRLSRFSSFRCATKNWVNFLDCKCSLGHNLNLISRLYNVGCLACHWKSISNLFTCVGIRYICWKNQCDIRLFIKLTEFVWWEKCVSGGFGSAYSGLNFEIAYCQGLLTIEQVGSYWNLLAFSCQVLKVIHERGLHLQPTYPMIFDSFHFCRCEGHFVVILRFGPATTVEFVGFCRICHFSRGQRSLTFSV